MVNWKQGADSPQNNFDGIDTFDLVVHHLFGFLDNAVCLQGVTRKELFDCLHSFRLLLLCVFVMLVQYAGDESEALEWPASVWWCVICKILLIQDEQECYAELCTESGLTSTVQSDTLPMRHKTSYAHHSWLSR